MRLNPLSAAILGASLCAVMASEPLSPSAVIADRSGKLLFIAGATTPGVLRYNLEKACVDASAQLPPSPSGLALSADGKELFVTCAAPESQIVVIDPATMKSTRTFKAGYHAMAPRLSNDGKVLYVCNRFDNQVAFIDAQTGLTIRQVRVQREPVAQALSVDGRHLLVANHIHAGRSDLDVVAAAVSIIDTQSGQVAKSVELPNGSGLLRSVAVSPDGRHACVAHLLARFHLPTTQIERGWINTAALSIIDLGRMERLNTVLLDNIDSGAANPWDVQWSEDGKHIVVTHAGTHEASVIQAPALLAKLARMPARRDPNAKVDYSVASQVAADVPNDLSFLVGVRKRVKFPPGNHGPRSVALANGKAHAVNYFSDTLASFAFAEERPMVETIELGPKTEPTLARKGEFYFNDASICFQGWQSCASCHSSEGRVDGLNWDNLNDGIGNPKNSKSLLLCFQTPPSMFLSVRETADVAVRAGIKNSLFTVQPDEVALAMDAYLQALAPDPSPHLADGKLSIAAQRGEKLFFSERVGCAECHKPPLYTDMKSHNVGTRSRYDKPGDKFDTPSLVEIWRSAPYLHDGSAATIRDVLTSRNPANEHGDLTGLNTAEIEDLAAYVLSL